MSCCALLVRRTLDYLRAMVKNESGTWTNCLQCLHDELRNGLRILSSRSIALGGVEHVFDAVSYSKNSRRSRFTRVHIRQCKCSTLTALCCTKRRIIHERAVRCELNTPGLQAVAEKNMAAQQCGGNWENLCWR